ASVSDGKTVFVIEPYTLLIYKKGVYLVANSLHHNAIRTFALDGFRAVDWQRNDRFDYPTDYHPSKLTDGAFGLVGGKPERVRIFFDETVSRVVRRRQWHPSQKIRNVDGGIVLTMNVATSFEITNWVLSFGAKALVLEPEGLRKEVAAELQRAAAKY